MCKFIVRRQDFGAIFFYSVTADSRSYGDSVRLVIEYRTRNVSANDMFVEFNSRKERKGNNLQGRGRGESASLSLIP